MRKSILYAGILSLGVLYNCTGKPEFTQVKLEARKAPIIKEGGYEFKDLNKNEKLDPYEDWRLPVDQRIDNLISLMTLEEKVGLMFHPNIAVPADGKVVYDSRKELGNEAYAGPVGPGGQGGKAMGMGQMQVGADAKTFIEEKNFRNILNNGVAPPKEFAIWSNSMQEYAEASRLGIPIMFSTDPRHGATLGAHVSGKQYFSQWPSKEGQVGITASRDTGLLKKFGETVAEEYRAVGLHMILGPQIDLMTEPRWSRNMGCFSEDAELTAEMLAAFMDGAQGAKVGPDKILVHLKHWPGSGPHKDGKGEWLVYPGNNLDYQLLPWKKGIEKGALAVMGYYSGTYVDTFNVCFSPYWSTKVLYDQLGFKGAICTDWGVVGRVGPMNPRFAGKTTLKDNMAMVVNAGVDQMGSETENELLIELVKEGRVTEDRINRAAKHILQWHFLLGLFEDPYVDPDAAVKILQSEKNQKDGYQAQLESIVLLTNDGLLPAKKGIKLYTEGIDKQIAANYGTIVENPKDADLILVRTGTAEDTGFPGFGGAAKDGKQPTREEMEKMMKEAMKRMNEREVNLNLPDKIWGNIKRLHQTGKPIVVAFNPSGSSVVLPGDLKEVTNGSIMVFDALDNALLDVVFGVFNPKGKLPFEIPASMEDVKNQKEDVPFDAPNKAFNFGDGLSYN
ncbi:MAG TPA: glycoside hydrolase family 3 N-terminal domain-containing protein [Bacteroidales bacterium]|nr:glycoside hydrolase family 3 N-terminal domain-containing protein [Bacteroidales bacterium]